MPHLARALAIACLLLIPFSHHTAAGTIETVAGGGPDDIPALQAPLQGVYDVTGDAAGNLYIADRQRAYRVDPSGVIHVLAGTGGDAFGGDGGPAITATMSRFGPAGVAVDAFGNVFLAEPQINNRIRRVDVATGIITTYAGNGGQYGGDGGPALNAGVEPYDLAFDSQGNLYHSDSRAHRVRRIDRVTSMVTTVAGGGTQFGENIPAVSARLDALGGIAFDAAGNLFIAANMKVLKVNLGTGLLSTYAGTGQGGYNGDGIPATTARIGPVAIAFGPTGDLYIADNGSTCLTVPPFSCTVPYYGIRKVDASTQLISTVAPGSYAAGGMWVNGAGDLFFPKGGSGQVVRMDAGSSAVTPVAGNGGALMGDGWTAHQLSIRPGGVAATSAGDLLVTDIDNHRVRKVDLDTGSVTTIAGGGPCCDLEGRPATQVQMLIPMDIELDQAGNMYILTADRILRVDTATQLVHVVTSGLNARAIALDASGNFYAVEPDNERVMFVNSSTGSKTRVAGTGSRTGWYDGPGGDPRDELGDGGPAIFATFAHPYAVAVDAAGNVYVGDDYNRRVRKVDIATGLISTVAGNGQIGFSGDGGDARLANLSAPLGLLLDSGGNLFIADGASDFFPIPNNRVRRVDAVTGVIQTVVGNGNACSQGDGGSPLQACIHAPEALAMNAAGQFFIVEAGGGRVRRAEMDGPPPPDPPTLSVNLSPSILWPPNHQMVEVTASFQITGTCTDPLMTLVSATSSEEDDLPGHQPDGDTIGDIQGADIGTDDRNVLLRAERNGDSWGRTYTLSWQVDCVEGTEAEGSVSVEVPHSMWGTTEPMILSLEEGPDGTQVSWDAVPEAGSYSLIRGSLAGVTWQPGNVNLGMVACLQWGTGALSNAASPDATMPAIGGALFYLVKYQGATAGGHGTELATGPYLPAGGDCPTP
jgi:sugar lactone lactonase YvrE